MTQPTVFFAVVSYGANVCREFLTCWTDTLGDFLRAGVGCHMSMVPGDPYLSKARNRAAFEFLVNHPHATHLFFLDDDVGWQPQAALRMVRHDVDVVAGVYPKKTDNGEWPVVVDCVDELPIERNGLWKARLAPTGFMCIRRGVLEKMAQRSGLYVDTTKVGDNTPQWNIFDMGWFTTDGERPPQQGGVMGQFWGEDYYFVRKCREAGIDVWIDPDIEFTHRGSAVWAGNYRRASEEHLAPIRARNAASAVSLERVNLDVPVAAAAK